MILEIQYDNNGYISALDIDGTVYLIEGETPSEIENIFGLLPKHISQYTGWWIYYGGQPAKVSVSDLWPGEVPQNCERY